MKNFCTRPLLPEKINLNSHRAMKLTCALLLASSIGVHATGYAQTEHINIQVTNTSTEKVLAAIEEQTDYLFVYDKSEVNLKRKATINAVNKSTSEVLSTLFDGTDVIYTMEGNNIMLMKKQRGDARGAMNVAQTITIKGKVVDASGEPVIGANVVVKGTTNGTITDLDGNFSLEVSKGSTLVVSFIGYVNYEQKIGNQKVLSITLKEDSKTLDELVVVGYGVQKKVNLTAAVETVNSDVLDNRPVKSAAEMLEGVVPNLNVSTLSGAPDAQSSLNIRGFTGMNSKGSPLVLVDGVEQSLDMVNPNDIDNISVLKDAAASAIYGSRAPYGVILVTTKSGEKGKKVSINYSGTYQLNQPSMLPHSASSVDFANSLNAAMNNSLKEGVYQADVIQKMQEYIDGKRTDFNEIRPNGWWGEHWDAYANTDYFGHAFKNVSQNTTHDLSLSGGTAKSSYYAGLGYNYREGIYNTDLDKFNRYSAVFKLDTEVTDWLKFKFNTRYVRQETTRPNYRNASGGADSDNHFWQELAYFPNIPIKNPDGSYNRLSAMPILEGMQGDIEAKKDDLWLTGGVEITPLKGLSIKGNFSWNTQSSSIDRVTKQYYIEEPNGQVVRGARSANVDKVYKGTNRSNYYTLDLTVDYHKQWNKHDFSALAGFQLEQKENNGMNGSSNGLYTPELPSINTSWGDNLSLREVKNHWSTMGYFFRLSYNYDSRYLLDVNGRYDAASKYPSNSRWAFFPSVSAGWNVANEKFWPIKAISTLKFTASIGKLGDQGGGNYLYLPTMGTGSMNDVILGGERPPYVTMPGIVAPNITWAKPRSIGFGVELGAFKNRLRAEYYWYQRTTKDQLGPAEKLPEVLGTNPPQTNNAVSETRGWELSLSWRDKACELADHPLNYNVRFILSDYVGYVVEYPSNISGIRGGWTRGQKFGQLYGYESAGIATNKETLQNSVLPGNGWYYPGDLMFVDRNGDGRIDSGIGGTWYSMGDQKEIGYTYPRYKYAINLGADWNNISVSMFLDGVGKECRYLNNFFTFGQTGSWSSRTMFEQHAELGYWSQTNPGAFFPRQYESSKNFSPTNDQYKINLSHLRIKNLTFGYTMPEQIVSKMKLSRLSFNFTIENLGFIYNKSWLDLDPQMIRNGAGGYPIQRTYSFGVKVGI